MNDDSINDTSTSSKGTVYENGVLPSIDSRFECSICLHWLKEPLLTSCGHRFCKECINAWISFKGRICPIDQQILDEHDLFPDNYTRREISQHTVQCPVEDCTQMVPLMDAEQHVTKCHQASTETNAECIFSNIGCEFIPLSYSGLKSHLETELQHHVALLGHICSGLTNRLNSQSFNSWKSKAEESKFWDPNKSKDSNSQQDSQDRIQHLLRDLYEKTILLDQKNREQEIQISSLRQQVAKLLVQNEQLTLDGALKYCNGEYIWNISEFSSKLEQMKIEPVTMFYSPGFYTSYFGYRFCARINLNVKDPKYITLNIHLMQGDNDNTLEWPFTGKIYLSLIHPTSSNLTIKEMMMSRPELEAFKRPTKMVNPRAFGYASFVSVESIEGFLKNDSLTIKIVIKSV